MSQEDDLQKTLNNSNVKKVLSIKLTPEQVEECREAFVMYDTDEDERITTAETIHALRALGHNTNQIIIEMIREVDIESEDGVGKLKFEEFLHFVRTCIKYAFTKDDMVSDLMAIDADNDGRLTKLELVNYLRNLNIPLCDEEIEDAVNGADLDDDGLIDFYEFSSKMCHYN